MSAAAAAILDGMPDARDLHLLDSGGQTMIFAGSRQLFRYRGDDTAMRNIAVAVLRQLGLRRPGGRRGDGADAEVCRDAAPAGEAGRDGGPGPRARPAPGDGDGRRGSRRGRGGRPGCRDAEIARRLGVASTTVRAGSAGRTCRQALPPGAAGRPAAAEPVRPRDPGPRSRESRPEPGRGPGLGRAPGRRPAACRPAALSSRYAGAMLLHAFLARAGAGTVLAAAGGEPRDVALLTAVSMCFALGAATTEQFKHLAAAEAGPLAGLGALPGLRALRPGPGTDRRRDRPGGAAAHVRVRDAGRGPGDLRRVLRR